MRDDRNRNYGDYNQDYDQRMRSGWQEGRYQGPEHADLGDTRHEPGQHYRLQQSRAYGRSGGREGNREDRYNEMYDISNYSDQPRSYEYGLPYGAENDLDRVERLPYGEGPYSRQPRHYRYSQGVNLNYDNPEEGDSYRDFDSRGNHGFRHDPGYGNQGEMRDFGNDHYGDPDRDNNRYYGYSSGYNR